MENGSPRKIELAGERKSGRNNSPAFDIAALPCHAGVAVSFFTALARLHPKSAIILTKNERRSHAATEFGFLEDVFVFSSGASFEIGPCAPFRIWKEPKYSRTKKSKNSQARWIHTRCRTHQRLDAVSSVLHVWIRNGRWQAKLHRAKIKFLLGKI